jgi:hypothetical protein
MSGLNSLLERVQRAYAKIAEVESVASRFPGDRSILINLKALQRDAASLEEAWQKASLHAQKEVCRYRIIPIDQTSYPIKQVSLSLANFQDLFSQIYEALAGKLKSKAQIKPSVASETAFNFAFSYPGSLGVAMTVDSQSNLFGGKYDEAIDAFMSILRLNDESEVRNTAKQYGLSVVNRAFDWSKTNLVSGYSVDIEWVNSHGRRKGGLADLQDFERIVFLIGKVSDVEHEKISAYGTLLGIDTSDSYPRFRFVKQNGEVYSGTLSDDFPADRQWAVNTLYTADIEVESVTTYATEDVRRTYRLKFLK